jgi:hypothetical protein
MTATLLQRLYNPRQRQCGCAPDCWCHRTRVGRILRWWFPGRLFGLPHKSAHTAEWKREQDRTDEG